MSNLSNRTPISSTGKAIQDHPSAEDLARDFAASRGWVQVNGFNAIFLPSSNQLIADNFTQLAWLMERKGGFIKTSLGTLQIHPDFHALSDEEVVGLFIRH